MKIMNVKRKARMQTNLDATTYTYYDTNRQTNKEMFTCTDMGEKVCNINDCLDRRCHCGQMRWDQI